MADAQHDSSHILRREFHAFWNAGLRADDYVDETAIVCFLDLDQEEVALTRVFYYTANDEGDNAERAEDFLVDWFDEEPLIQRAEAIDIRLYMNYSPLKLTVDGLIAAFDNLKEMGKDVKVALKFVELYKTGEGEEDAEENGEGLRALRNYGVDLDVMKGRDWLFLMQTLIQKAGKKRQGERNAATRSRLLRLLKHPHDVGTDTPALPFAEVGTMTDAPPEVTEAEVMTDSPATPPPSEPEEAKSSSSEEEDD